MPGGSPVHAMNARRRAKSEQAAALVADLYVHGKPIAEIASTLKVSRGAISRAMVRMREIWKAKLEVGSEVVKSEQLAKLDKMEAEAWDAWQRSKRESEERIREKNYSQKNGPGHKNAIKKANRDGDPRYLEIVLKVVQKRMELLGLLKPESELGNSDSGLIEVVISSRAEAAKMLPYLDFANAVNGDDEAIDVESQQVEPEA